MPQQLLAPAGRDYVLQNLPVFPAVALELIDLVDEGGPADATEIARMLGRDPALSAQVLRQTNSARFGGQSRVTDLTDAVARLGTDQTCRVAMAAACKGLVSPALGRLELRSCWERCVATAILASVLAPELEIEPGPAYTAGLLHDVGCLALMALYPDSYVETVALMRTKCLGWIQAERKVFGITHCTVGHWLIEEWKLGDDLDDVVLHHHDERELDHSLVSLIVMASTLADLLQPHPLERLPWRDAAQYVETLPLEDKPRVLETIDGARERIEVELQ